MDQKRNYVKIEHIQLLNKLGKKRRKKSERERERERTNINIHISDSLMIIERERGNTFIRDMDNSVK